MVKKDLLLLLAAFAPALSFSMFIYIDLYYHSYLSGPAYFSGPLPTMGELTAASYFVASPILMLIYFGSRTNYLAIALVELVSYGITFSVMFTLWPPFTPGTGVGYQIFPRYVQSFFPLLPLIVTLLAGYPTSRSRKNSRPLISSKY